MSPDGLSVALRALSFVALLQGAGIAIFLWWFRGHLRESATEIRRLGLWSAAIAPMVLAGQFILEAARIAGDFTGILDPSLQRIAFASSAAVSFGVRLTGVVFILASLSRTHPRGAVLGVGGALLIGASFALVGHTAVHPWRVLLAPALVSHVLVAAFWLGAIPGLYLVTIRETPELAGRAVEAFSRIAIWAVPVLAIVGVLMALVLVRHPATFREPYGWLLLVKIGGFALMMAFAAANRLRLGAAVARGETRCFKRSLAAEYVLLAGVLAVTATMTSLYSPEP